MEIQGTNKKIGDFLIGKTIGEGTFGKVKQGIHMPTGKKVAIKILQKQKIRVKTDLQRVHNQLRILHSKIHHEGILSLLQLHETPTSLYIVTQHIEGKQLYQIIVEQSSLPQQLCGLYLVQLIDAVCYLHSIGVCHRDIKPQNIMVQTKTGKIKLIDFGLSKQFGQDRLLSTSCGSPCYAAPQMINSSRKGKYDCVKTDTWAIGVTLYAMVAGCLPFQHQNTDRLYEMINLGKFKQILSLQQASQNTLQNHHELSRIQLSSQFCLKNINQLLESLLQTNPQNRPTLQKLVQQNKWLAAYQHLTQKNIQLKSQGNQPQLLYSMSKYFNKGIKEIRQIIQNKSIASISTYFWLSQKSYINDKLANKCETFANFNQQNCAQHRQNQVGSLNLAKDKVNRSKSKQKNKSNSKQSKQYQNINNQYLNNGMLNKNNRFFNSPYKNKSITNFLSQPNPESGVKNQSANDINIKNTVTNVFKNSMANNSNPITTQQINKNYDVINKKNCTQLSKHILKQINDGNHGQKNKLKDHIQANNHNKNRITSTKLINAQKQHSQHPQQIQVHKGQFHLNCVFNTLKQCYGYIYDKILPSLQSQDKQAKRQLSTMHINNQKQTTNNSKNKLIKNKLVVNKFKYGSQQIQQESEGQNETQLDQQFTKQPNKQYNLRSNHTHYQNNKQIATNEHQQYKHIECQQQYFCYNNKYVLSSSVQGQSHLQNNVYSQCIQQQVHLQQQHQQLYNQETVQPICQQNEKIVEISKYILSFKNMIMKIKRIDNTNLFYLDLPSYLLCANNNN